MFEGYNGTIFAYGQTGSGKSFTMFGKEHSQDPLLQGVIPRAAQSIFERCRAERYLPDGAENPDTKIKAFQIKASYLEIYMGSVNDLLDPRKKDLKVHFDLRRRRGVWVEGLTEKYVRSMEEIMQFINFGDTNRHKKQTGMNDSSSRSHSVFFIELEQQKKDGSTTSSKLCLADLAGSERVSRSKVEGEAFDEACAINESLGALNNCLHALTEGQSGSHLYRASRLTQILAESLGGNSKTTLVVAMSPAADSFDETLGTLRFAQRAKTLKNKVQKNEMLSPDAMLKMIQDLQNMVEQQKKYIACLEEALKAKGGDVAAVRKKAGGSGVVQGGLSRSQSSLLGVEEEEEGEQISVAQGEYDEIMSKMVQLQQEKEQLEETVATMKATVENVRLQSTQELAHMTEEMKECEKKAHSDHELYQSMRLKFKEAKEEQEQLKEKLRTCEAECATLKADMETEVKSRAESAAEMESRDKEIKAWQQEMHKKTEQLHEVGRELANVKSDFNQLTIEKQRADTRADSEHEANASMASEINEWKVAVKAQKAKTDAAQAEIDELKKAKERFEGDLKRAATEKTSIQEERTAVREQNEALKVQVLEAQTKLSNLAHTESSNDELVAKVSSFQTECTKLQHEVDRLQTVVQRKKAKKAQLREENTQLHQQLLDAASEANQLKASAEELRVAMSAKDDEIKELKEQNERLSQKVREEMQSVKYWMNDHKQLTDELDEEHDNHRKTMARMEERVADLDEQLKESWSARRDALQTQRDKERENKRMEKELARKESEINHLKAKLQQGEEKAEMSKKLLDVKIQHINEMDHKMTENSVLLDAYKNHVTCMQFERDEAIERLKVLEKGGGSGLNSGDMVTAI